MSHAVATRNVVALAKKGYADVIGLLHNRVLGDVTCSCHTQRRCARQKGLRRRHWSPAQPGAWRCHMQLPHATSLRSPKRATQTSLVSCTTGCLEMSHAVATRNVVALAKKGYAD